MQRAVQVWTCARVVQRSAMRGPIHQLLVHRREAALGTTSHIWIGAQLASACETIYMVKSAPRIAPWLALMQVCSRLKVIWCVAASYVLKYIPGFNLLEPGALSGFIFYYFDNLSNQLRLIG